MRIIKTAGTSETNTEGERKFVSRPTTKTPVEERLAVERYANDYNKVIIGQWMSIIDKIFRKPQTDKKTGKSKGPIQKQYALRNSLGVACWNILKNGERLRLPNNQGDQVRELLELKKIWDWRLHPYGGRDTIVKEDKKNKTIIKGRWYKAFLGDQSFEKIDHALLAEKIEDHLHNHEIRIDGKPKEFSNPDRKTVGLINSRAASIASNSLSDRFGNKTDRENYKAPAYNTDLNWSDADEAAFLKTGDLAAEIYRANSQKEAGTSKFKKNRDTLHSSEAGALIFKHYGKHFGDNEGKVPKRIDLQKSHTGVLSIYDTVRNYYKTFLKTHRKQSLEQTLPENGKALFNRLKQKLDNRNTNDLIRLGRVLHYHNSSNFSGGKLDDQLFSMSNSQIQQSHYWTSEGQSEIKRTETFVRIWRNAISQGSRSIKNLTDPNDRFDGDILSEASWKRFAESKALSDDEEESFGTSFLNMFGESADFFLIKSNFKEDKAWRIQPKQIAHMAVKAMTECRHGLFHFSDRKSFTKHLKSKLKNLAKENTEFVSAANRMLQTDEKLKDHRIVKDCHGAGLQLFANQMDLDQLTANLQGASGSDVILPKFNELQKQLSNTGQLAFDTKRTLPEPASHVELKNDALRAKYVGFKMIYENIFRAWLGKKGKDQAVVKKWITQAVLETQQRLKKTQWEEASFEAYRSLRDKAKRENKHFSKDTQPTDLQIRAKLNPHHDMMFSKVMDTFEAVPDTITLDGFLEQLTAQTASDMQIQKGYASDPEASSKHGKWINNFRMDVIGIAFKDFIYSPDLQFNPTWLLLLNSASTKVSETSKPPQKPDSTNIVERMDDETNWQTLFYFVLHFIPVDEIAQLLHQFRKWKALENKAATRDGEDQDIAALRNLLELYQTMHDDKFDGADVGLGVEQFRNMFEKAEDFDQLFLDQNSTDELLAGTRRGLREISRFGHLSILQKILNHEKISHKDVLKLKELEAPVQYDGKTHTKVAVAQLKRKVLHQLIVDDADNMTPENHKAYKEHIEDIADHKNLTSQVRLNGLIKVHRLLMMILARLVDYSAIWERDLYFITLALIYLEQKTPSELLIGRAINEFVEGGKVLTGEHSMDQNLETKLLKYHSIERHEARNTIEKERATEETKKHLNSRQIRNDFAHFNILKKGRGKVDLTYEIDRVRHMLRYDRKLKNAVTKSIIDLMYREGLNLSWMTSGHKLVSPSIKTRDIEHLSKFQKTLYFKLYEANGLLGNDKNLDEEAKKKRQNQRTALRDAYKVISEPMHPRSYLKLVKSLWGIESDSETDEHVDKKRKNGRKKRRDRRYYGKKR